MSEDIAAALPADRYPKATIRRIPSIARAYREWQKIDQELADIRQAMAEHIATLRIR